MKNILGLDLGTNSIGWALLSREDNELLNRIVAANSRIIPMDAACLSDFEKGITQSQTAKRTEDRGRRRLTERYLLRRERLHRILNILGFLPPHYAKCIDFEIHFGKFIENAEPKLPWCKTENGTFEFIFKDSFAEMLADFAENQPDLVSGNKKIPYDWTIYYLRKKALTCKIKKEELAWILLNFNQKRGYYQLRGEDAEADSAKKAEFYALKVIRVEATGQIRERSTQYNVLLENGWIYTRKSDRPLNWEGQVKEFIVTTEYDKNGNPKLDKEGNIRRKFRVPNENDWTLVKKKTEKDVELSHKTVGAYIYDTLLQNPSQKIRGKLIRTIERDFYKNELIAILKKQIEEHPELQDRNLYAASILNLYPHNKAHRENIADKNFIDLFVEDILFYQRPLKSKKSLIANCPFEFRRYRDKASGEWKIAPVKCIAKSHPLYQEFRLWQFIGNLRIYQREKVDNGTLKLDVDVTNNWLQNEADYIALFNWLNDRSEIKQDTLLKSYFKIKEDKTKDRLPFRWNYVEEKSYPCNETRAAFLQQLKKANIPTTCLTPVIEEALWHILYSVKDRNEIKKALVSFRNNKKLDGNFVVAFAEFPPFKKEYGAYSAKAIKKLLSLMRMGSYWDENEIDKNTKERIDKIISGEYDEKIQEQVRNKAAHLQQIIDFKGLPLWLASYIVYNRHSEAGNISKWETPADLEAYLHSFKQHSLRNPIVEQVILETLRTVCDIWKKVGKIDEIHIELGRSLKNPVQVRKKIAAQTLENENANLRIKYLLREFLNPEYEIENVRPYSPSQQELLKIYEDGVLSSSKVPDDILSVIQKFRETDSRKQPTKAEILKYKLWLEQKYCSPYTGEIIPLGKLFTPAYEIEHIIPRKRFFDDSFSNKVICESEVNKLKGSLLGYEFIKQNAGALVQLNYGKAVKIFTVDKYEDFIKRNYSGARNRRKLRNLLIDEISDSFVERQLNDTRYISKLIKYLLSNIVREPGEQEAISKNVIICTGEITNRLKEDWGIKEIWNDLIYPRFENLNKLLSTTQFTAFSERAQKYIPAMPIELQKGFDKKRIDHRHHAMDAIVIACTTRNIVNYLNNASARKNAPITRYDLQHLLCDKKFAANWNDYKWVIKKPWATFTQDTRTALENALVSFKQNLRVISKTTNLYRCYDEEGRKVIRKQVKGDHWAIRKPMHKETVFGRVNLRKIKEVSLSVALKKPERIVDKRLKAKITELLSLNNQPKQIEKYFKENADRWNGYNWAKLSVYYFTDEVSDSKKFFVAVRKSLDSSFDEKRIRESVTDTGIQKILLNHLKNYGGDAKVAFSPDNIDEMNRHIKELNGGKFHQPIIKVRCYEKSSRFSVGINGNKERKFVETATGTNLFFAVYQTKNGKRTYETIPLNVVIENQKQGYPSVPPIDDNGNKLLFYLSPNDFIYIPTEEEMENKDRFSYSIDKQRIYRVVKFTQKRLYILPYYVANTLMDKKEFTSENVLELTTQKEICIPIKVNRLGEIISIDGKKYTGL